MAVAVVALLAGCAGTGAGSPDGTPPSATVVLSAAAVVPSAGAVPLPVSAVPVPPISARSGASCALGAPPLPSVDPSASIDPNDPMQRIRHILAEQYRPTPRRGVVPEAAALGAEACIRSLKIQFSLLMAGGQNVPDKPAIDAALRSAGLTKIIVGSGPAFGASTGAACVYGTFIATEPAFTISPPAADGSCP
jgi:hypothetical protein